MKKVGLLLLIMSNCFIIIAQENIPKNLLKGVEIKNDEFTGATNYSIPDCCLSITQEKESVKLFISLACSSYGSPIKLNKIYILTNGNTTIINHDSDFSFKEIPERYMKRASSGNFGTSSYKAAQFDTRIRYVDVWKTNASKYIPMIESMINNLGKVKFEGENNTLYLEFKKKDAAKMGTMLKLFEYLAG